MTLDAMKCFCALVETGSFRAAAERVFRSQPAVSQQMRSLEREVGHSLVDRRTGRPTAQGQVLYARARDILRAMEALQRELADQDTGPAGELRLGTSDTTAMYLLPPYVRRFAERLPQARLAVTNRSSDAIAAQAIDTVDFARTVKNAWEDGVRVFVEHGPRSLCSGWIANTLGSREHLAVSLDSHGRPSIRHALEAAGALVAAGVRVDHATLVNRLTPPIATVPAGRTPMPPLSFAAHMPPVNLPPL